MNLASIHGKIQKSSRNSFWVERGVRSGETKIRPVFRLTFGHCSIGEESVPTSGAPHLSSLNRHAERSCHNRSLNTSPSCETFASPVDRRPRAFGVGRRQYYVEWRRCTYPFLLQQAQPETLQPSGIVGEVAIADT